MQRRKNSNRQRKNQQIEEVFQFTKGRIENPQIRNILRWAFQIFVTLTVSAMVAIFFFQPVTMQESAMQPTIAIGDKFLMNQIIYKVSSPKRGDIIAFRTNGNSESPLHIRRVIALPGESVQIVNGWILINGEHYVEDLGLPDIKNGGTVEKKAIRLGNNEYFVLGDNRNNSEDSRYPDIGIVNKKYMAGKLWIQTAPADKIGWFE